MPILHEGPFSEAMLNGCTGDHLREGAVVRPVVERESAEFGRVILKSVSGDYLTRKGGTEFN